MEENATKIGGLIMMAFLVMIIFGFLAIGILCVMMVHEDNQNAERMNRIEQYILESED